MATENGYLSLGFEVGEWAYIDGPCVVRLAQGSKVRIAFRADRDVSIVRASLLPYEKRVELGMAVPPARRENDPGRGPCAGANGGPGAAKARE